MHSLQQAYIARRKVKDGQVPQTLDLHHNVDRKSFSAMNVLLQGADVQVPAGNLCCAELSLLLNQHSNSLMSQRYTRSAKESC
jgi:hypothetical protein